MIEVLSIINSFLANQNVLVYLSIIIGLAALLTLIARAIRQPPIIAYLISGVLVGPFLLNIIGPGSSSSEVIQTFAHIGVAFLLFIVGLNLDLRVLKELGIVSTFAGISEIILTGSIGFLIAIGIGFSNTISLFIGTALAFSSTVVVVKILSDKKEIDTLHGRIALGILIVEDFVAALALMAIPIFNEGGTIYTIAKEAGIIILLIAFISIFSVVVLNRIMNYLAIHQETLFLFGIAWALVLATIFDLLGFSFEIGALIAGMSLASSKYTLELGSKIKPLRDFFVVLFFVFFGSQLSQGITFSMIKIALLFSAFVFVGKPIIVMSILRLFGYKKRTNFLASSSLTQISEFSLIIALLGFNLGYLTQEIMSIIVLVAIITIGASSYSIYYSNSIFNRISHLLGIFEGKRFEKEKKKEESYEIILIGYHRIGYKILDTLKKMNKSFVVIDYNPKVILSLLEHKINAIYGDAGDKNFLNELKLDKVKLIISTIPEEGTNVAIIEKLKEINSSAVFMATAEEPRIAFDLYSEGVDYVIIPHHLGGDYASDMIKNFKTEKSKYKQAGKDHLHELKRGRTKSSFF